MGNPKFIQTAVNSGGRATVANTAVDGTGALVTIAAGSGPGLRIDRVSFRANATTAASKLRIIYIRGGADALHPRDSCRCGHDERDGRGVEERLGP